MKNIIFPVSLYKSENVAQSQNFFALTHVRVSVTFRNSVNVVVVEVVVVIAGIVIILILTLILMLVFG